EAKPSSADGTAPERVWESRTPPNTPNVEGRTQPCGPRRISHPRPTTAHAIRKDGTVAPPPPRDQGRPGDRAGGTGGYRRTGGTGGGRRDQPADRADRNGADRSGGDRRTFRGGPPGTSPRRDRSAAPGGREGGYGRSGGSPGSDRSSGARGYGQGPTGGDRGYGQRAGGDYPRGRGQDRGDDRQPGRGRPFDRDDRQAGRRDGPARG